MKSKNLPISLLLLPMLLFFNLNVMAQTIDWERNYGGSDLDYMHSFKITTDNGYILAGFSISDDGDVSGNYGQMDVWLVKLDQEANIEWEKNYGGSDFDLASTIIQAPDGGYVVVGKTRSGDGDFSANYGDYDLFVIKVNEIGEIEWEKNMGGGGLDEANEVQATPDGGYIIVGLSDSTDGDITDNKGNKDVWVVKLDGTGEVQWKKNYGGTADDSAASIKQTTDGGYIIAGRSSSFNGDVSNNNGLFDLWIFKINGAGDLEWEKSYGGSQDEGASSIQQTIDGGYIVIGNSYSNDGDLSANNGGADYWVIKIDETGGLEWENNLGGNLDDFGREILEIPNGGYMVFGNSRSSDGDVSNHYFAADYWVIELDQLGEIRWEKSFGGTGLEKGIEMYQTTDGKYLLGGSTMSDDHDIGEFYGASDYWLLQLNPPISSVDKSKVEADFNVYPNPSNGYFMLTIATQRDDTNVQIHDLFGRLVYTKKVKEYQLQIEGLAKGVYCLRLETDQKISTQKIIIQ